MLILGQTICFLGPTIFKIPQPYWCWNYILAYFDVELHWLLLQLVWLLKQSMIFLAFLLALIWLSHLSQWTEFKNCIRKTINFWPSTWRNNWLIRIIDITVKLDDKERFDKEQIGVKCEGTISRKQFVIYFIRLRNIWH